MNDSALTNHRHIRFTNISLGSELLDYLVEHHAQDDNRVPALNELSDELHVSVSKLREQLEVARHLGLVSVRPRTGIHRQEYSFMPAVRLGLFYALASNVVLFDAYSQLRQRIEISFWREAVAALTDDDKQHLQALIQQAWSKLRGNPIRIPHREHREFHLTIFQRLDNIFVRGLLEAYWEAYEAVELHTYADYDYLQEVWQYHERIAQMIVDDDVDGSLQAFIDHIKLLKNFSESK
jgi:DNA-binding FadR family transcriptional regulator